MVRRRKKTWREINNALTISDPHCGHRQALYPPKLPPDLRLDADMKVLQNRVQKIIWGYWNYAWETWAPRVCRGEDYALIIDGDVVEGVHHNAVDNITNNLTDQKRIALAVLKPICERAAEVYMVRGTPAHGGQSSQDEEELARDLGAIPDEDGRYCREHLHLIVGRRTGKGRREGCLIHALHHIGTSGSAAYEATAINKELIEEFAAAAQWEGRRPDVVIRGHRHRHCQVTLPTARGYGIAFTCASWKGKDQFAHKVPGARVTPAQIGIHLVRQGDEEFYARHWVKTIAKRPPVIAGRAA